MHLHSFGHGVSLLQPLKGMPVPDAEQLFRYCNVHTAEWQTTLCMSVCPHYAFLRSSTLGASQGLGLSSEDVKRPL